MDAEALARAYYDAIDAGEYDELRGLLAPDFEQVRPDRRFRGREEFVSFMRDDRPRTDTRHVVDEVYGGADGVAVRGRLLGADESGADEREELFAFVDVFAVADDELAELTTYANSSSTAGSTSSS